MSAMREKLLDAAEAAMRQRGYHAVSFRDLANELGIKSASIHYHFPKKEDLGVALIERYAIGVMAALNSHQAATTSPVAAMSDVYRKALNPSGRICLCGMVGAESLGLPERVAEKVGQFFNSNISWLENAFGPGPNAKVHAVHTVSALQGAMIVAVTTGDRTLFEAVAGSLAEYPSKSSF